MNLSRSVEILCLVILPVISYFIGNISPATLVGRLYGVDIRKEGSGNPGTTNVLRTLGKKEAAATLLVDVLKGFLPDICRRSCGFRSGGYSLRDSGSFGAHVAGLF